MPKLSFFHLTMRQKSKGGSAASKKKIVPPVFKPRHMTKHVLGRNKAEERGVREYVEVEARGEKVQHLEKLHSEPIFDRALECWDVHTNKDRYWVITQPTNLYSQKQFPSMDYAISFHVGVTTRMTARDRILTDDQQQIERFLTAWRKLNQAGESIDNSREAEDYQAVGMRCRECLIEFVKSSAKRLPLQRGEIAPKAADFVHWAEIIARCVAPGSSNEGSKELSQC